MHSVQDFRKEGIRHHSFYLYDEKPVKSPFWWPNEKMEESQTRDCETDEKGRTKLIPNLSK